MCSGKRFQCESTEARVFGQCKSNRLFGRLSDDLLYTRPWKLTPFSQYARGVSSEVRFFAFKVENCSREMCHTQATLCVTCKAPREPLALQRRAGGSS